MSELKNILRDWQEVEFNLADLPEGRFVSGQRVPKAHPHNGLGGGTHKGNVGVLWTSGEGDEAAVKCVMPDCGVRIILVGRK